MSDAPKAVVLLSGGLDSAVCLAIARSQGYRCYALSFRYGQRHDREVTASHRVARSLDVADHVISNIDLRTFGGSALTAGVDVPKHGKVSDIDSGIPITYVPARNTIFLSFALGWAEVLQANAIFIGVNAVDYSGYPDCRIEFIQAFQHTARLATKGGVEGNWTVRVEAPLIDMSKSEIVRKGSELGVDFALTWSCYDPGEDGKPCGACDSCLLRERGFADAGIADPLRS